jgi:hypothetical protein
MMRRQSKFRFALLFGSALALLPAASQATAGKGVAWNGFSAPEHPVILTRELRRVMAPGLEIVSRRSYELRFLRQGNGWQVDGSLVETEVDAPAGLAPLVALEKARKDEGLFPLHLNNEGLIVSQPGADDAIAAGKARTVVSSSVEKLDMSGTDKAIAAQMVQRISAQSRVVGGNWPVDLFRPVAGPRTRVQDVQLPGGKQGKVTVTVQANPDQRGLLEQFERRVLTELDGTSRLSLETWRMSSMP